MLELTGRLRLRLDQRFRFVLAIFCFRIVDLNPCSETIDSNVYRWLPAT
jgi:hypothetical protein